MLYIYIACYPHLFRYLSFLILSTWDPMTFTWARGPSAWREVPNPNRPVPGSRGCFQRRPVMSAFFFRKKQKKQKPNRVFLWYTYGNYVYVYIYYVCVILYVWKSKICLDIGRALALSTIDQCQWRFLDMFDNSSCYLPLRWNLSCSILSDTSCVLHLLFFGSQYPRDWIISLVKIKSCCIIAHTINPTGFRSHCSKKEVSQSDGATPQTIQHWTMTRPSCGLGSR